MSIEPRYVQFPRSSFESRMKGIMNLKSYPTDLMWKTWPKPSPVGRPLKWEMRSMLFFKSGCRGECYLIRCQSIPTESGKPGRNKLGEDSMTAKSKDELSTLMT